MISARRLGVCALTVLASIVLVGCGDKKLSRTQEQVNNYLLGLPGLPVGSSYDKPTGPTVNSTESSAGLTYQCQTTPESLAEDPDDIVSQDADGGKLWLGALLQGGGYAGGPGSLAELPLGPRAPLTIYTDLPGKHIQATVANPTGASVQQAIDGLVTQAEKAKINPPANLSYSEDDAQSVDQALLKAGLSVKYLGGQATADLDLESSLGDSSILVTVTQRLFTVKIVKPADPVLYFGNKITLQDVKDQQAAGRISPTNPPVVVSQISYGLKLIYTVTAHASSDELKADVTASYDGGAVSGSVSVNAQEQQILNSAHYGVVAIGGSEDATRTLIRTHGIGDYLKAKTALTDAVPIAYQVDNVGNDSAAAFSETTSYNLKTCSPVVHQTMKVGEVDEIEGGISGDDVSSKTCATPYLFGDLYVDGQQVYHQVDDGDNNDHGHYDGPAVSGPFSFNPAHVQDYRVGSEVDLTPYGVNSQNLGPWQFVVLGNPGQNTLTIKGAIDDHKNIGHYPVNTYNATFTYPNIPLGTVTIKGNSPGCEIDLTLTIVHVEDLQK